MRSELSRRARTGLVVLCAVCTLVGTGCGPKRVPAGGKVELDGKPLEGGILYFNPDTSKGNTARIMGSSPVKNGHFDLRTDGIERSDGGPGIPLGWYKVSVRVNQAGEPPRFPGPAVVDIDPIYLSHEKTPISIEIVENPAEGAYDIAFKKK
jgi:hypothetical protein